MALGDSTFIDQDPSLYVDNDELSVLKKYVLRKLGWPLIRVEITDEQLVDAILDAVQVYHEYAAIDYQIERVNPSTGNVIDIPDHINGKFIVDVLFQRDYFDSLSAGLGAMGYAETMGGVLPYDASGRSPIVGNFDLAQYYLYLQHMEDFKKLVGITRQWEAFGRKIHLYPATMVQKEVGILYKPMLNEGSAGQSKWIKDYAVAGAQMTVGIIRSKLGGFSSTGANLSVDGEAMKSEARAQLDKLEESIKTGGGIPMPFLQM